MGLYGNFFSDCIDLWFEVKNSISYVIEFKRFVDYIGIGGWKVC